MSLVFHDFSGRDVGKHSVSEKELREARAEHDELFRQMEEATRLQSEVHMTWGQVAYEAYSRAIGGVTYDGKPIPLWEALSVEVRAAWEGTAKAVANQVELVKAGPVSSKERT